MSINKESYNTYMSDRGSYAIIPNEIWERKDLDHTAKVIWCYLVSRDPKWQSSRNNIAKNLGMGVNTVSLYIAELKSLNLIEIHERPNGAWSFKINSPNAWIQERSESKGIQIQLESTTESISDPDLDLDQIHTQEAKINKCLANSSFSSQEARVSFPEEAGGDQKDKSNSQIPENDKITPQGVLISWRSHYPTGLGFLSGRKAAPALSELFFNLKKYGFEKNEITNAQIIKLVFGSRPQSKLNNWIEDLHDQIDIQRIAIFEKTIEIEDVPEVDDLGELISPEAVAKYKQFVADGRTPADFGGMSLIDYANMRAYVEEFPIIRPN